MEALDLSRENPRKPSTLLGGYVILARTLDKCRAEIAGTIDDYIFGCPLDNMFFDFTGVSAQDFKEFVSTGADDVAVVAWIEEHARGHSQEEKNNWNRKVLG